MLKGKRKLMLVPVLLLLVGAGYSFAKPKPVEKLKVKGTIYQLPQSFLLNLSDGHYVKLNVALLLTPGQSTGASASGGSSSGSEGEAAGTLPEEAIVRSIITNVVTGKTSTALIEERGRNVIKHEILLAIEKQTDVKAESVLFPDLTIQ
jgi:flagellar basal body-associated protein FliL